MRALTRILAGGVATLLVALLTGSAPVAFVAGLVVAAHLS